MGSRGQSSALGEKLHGVLKLPEIPDRKNEEVEAQGPKWRKNSSRFHLTRKGFVCREQEEELSLPGGWFLAYQSKLIKYIFSQSMPKCNSAKKSLEGSLCLTRENVVLMAETFPMTVIAAILILRPGGA